MSTPASKSDSAWARFLAVLVVVFLLFGPYLANLMVDHSRQVFQWRTSDSLTLIGLMTGLALASVLIGAAIRRLGPAMLVRVADQALILGLGAGLLANLWFQTSRPVGYHIGQFGMEMRTLWVLLGGLIGCSLVRPDWNLARRCRQLCLVFSPPVVIVTVQLLRASTYPAAMDALPAPASVAHAPDPASSVRPVYWFVFDEWSYERTFEAGEVRADLPNLARLSKQSITFHDAHSPGPETELALARLLFETDRPVVSGRGRVGFERDGGFVASHDCRSVFDRFGEQGYHRFFVGFALPFGSWLKGHVDV